MADELLTIGALARQARRRASSIRYYEQIGLLPEPVRSGGQRRYSRGWLKVLAVIDIAKRAGLSLDQIKALVAAAPPGGHGPSGHAADGHASDGHAADGHAAGAQAAGGQAVGELRRVAAERLPSAAAELERARQAVAWLEMASSCQCPTLTDCPLFAR
jgi:DNA-binding transcriptional MerR regulator